MPISMPLTTGPATLPADQKKPNCKNEKTLLASEQEDDMDEATESAQ
jgi:hypothetical protein